MEIKKTAGELAADRYNEGYNCAESILHVFRDELKLDLSDDVLKIATGFGGGVGGEGCMCGALTAAIMVINIMLGRTGPNESRSPSYKNSKEFHQRFAQEFGGTCCRLISPHPFGSPEKRSCCLKITSKTADLLMQMLEENQLLKDL